MVEVTDYAEYGIRISTHHLDIGEAYYFRFSEPLEHLGSDERVFTLFRKTDDAVIAVSFPDPNDLQKPFNAGPEG
ncbi:MAG: hypothetical protein IKE77_04495, partial [Erysipelotrichaceae bacterium]|nr:hypothetical protein [Erysipelotrichaceae bacterium]